MRIKNAEVKIVKGDIVSLEVECIVNAAHEALMGGGGVDGAIHRKAGPRLIQECQEIEEVERGIRCRVGEVKVTGGYNLPYAKWIIHTVAPSYMGSVSKGLGLADLGNWGLTKNIYKNAKPGTDDDLARCYRNCLIEAEKLGVGSIGFPSLGTGGHGYPIEVAAPIAKASVIKYLESVESGIKMVYFVCYSDIDFETYRDIIRNAS